MLSEREQEGKKEGGGVSGLRSGMFLEDLAGN